MLLVDLCSSLTSIFVNWTNWFRTINNTWDWVRDVAPTGIFYKPDALSTEYGVHRIPENWKVISNSPLLFTAKEAGGIALSTVGSPDAISLNYKKNDGDWTEYSLCSVIPLAANDTIAFSGVNDHFSKDCSNYYNFVMTGSIEAEGNIQSLMNYNDDLPAYGYFGLFSGNCTGLVNTPDLPITNLTNYCYGKMFANC